MIQKYPLSKRYIVSYGYLNSCLDKCGVTCSGCCLFTYNVAGREVAYGILSSQRNRAEHDEDQDEVGEDLMVDEFVAEHTNPAAAARTETGGRGLDWFDDAASSLRLLLV